MTAVNKQVFRHGNPLYVLAKVLYSQAIKKGEMLKLAIATGVCTPVSAASDNDTLYGIAEEAHAALAADDSKVHTVKVALIDPTSIYEFPITGTPSLVAGQGLSISDSQTLALAATDHVALAIETQAAATSCRVCFLNPPLLGGASQATSFDGA